jgi:hypothetical protein
MENDNNNIGPLGEYKQTTSSRELKDLDTLIQAGTQAEVQSRVQRLRAANTELPIRNAIAELLAKLVLAGAPFQAVFRPEIFDDETTLASKRKALSDCALRLRWILSTSDSYKELYDAVLQFADDPRNQGPRQYIQHTISQFKDQPLSAQEPATELWQRTLPRKPSGSQAEHEQLWRCACDLTGRGYFKRAKLVRACMELNGIENRAASVQRKCDDLQSGVRNG